MRLRAGDRRGGAVTETFLELVGRESERIICRMSCREASVSASPSLGPSSWPRAVLLADEPTGNLDTATGGEILDLLKRINREIGSTLVMVTHDADAAAACRRILSLKDGKLVSDRSA